jgi:hypothetical protein
LPTLVLALSSCSDLAIQERARGIVSTFLVFTVLWNHNWLKFCVALTAAPLVMSIVSIRRTDATFRTAHTIVRCDDRVVVALWWMSLICTA